MASRNEAPRPVTREDVILMVAEYPGLQAQLDGEVGPAATLTNCTNKNDEGLECGKPISFVVNLGRLRDNGLTEKGTFPMRPADPKATLAGIVASRTPHQCLVPGAPRVGVEA